MFGKNNKIRRKGEILNSKFENPIAKSSDSDHRIMPNFKVANASTKLSQRVFFRPVQRKATGKLKAG